jgi:hypothetical protein
MCTVIMSPVLRQRGDRVPLHGRATSSLILFGRFPQASSQTNQYIRDQQHVVIGDTF